jgi:hypothetical protein
MNVVLFLILMFAIFRIVALVTWLALALIVVIHNIFESLTGFIFLSLHPPVLSAPPMLLRLGHLCGSRLSALLYRGLLGSVLGQESLDHCQDCRLEKQI